MTNPLTPAERREIEADFATARNAPWSSCVCGICQAAKRIVDNHTPRLLAELDRLTALLQPPSDERLANALRWADKTGVAYDPGDCASVVLATAYRAEHAEAERLRAIVERLPKTADGAGMIAAERRRHVEKKGWSAEHDDSHPSATLAVAGACYALTAASEIGEFHPSWHARWYEQARALWPFDEEWWKPTSDPVRTLVKAGSMIAAEIDKAIRRRSKSTREAAEAAKGGAQ